MKFWIKDILCKILGHRGKIVSTATDGSGGIFYCHRCDMTFDITWKDTFIEIDFDE
jgi:hypothetical protein